MNRFVKLGFFYATILAVVGWFALFLTLPKPWNEIVGLTPPVTALVILMSYLLIDVTKEILRG